MYLIHQFYQLAIFTDMPIFQFSSAMSFTIWRGITNLAPPTGFSLFYRFTILIILTDFTNFTNLAPVPDCCRFRIFSDLSTLQGILLYSEFITWRTRGAIREIFHFSTITYHGSVFQRNAVNHPSRITICLFGQQYYDSAIRYADIDGSMNHQTAAPPRVAFF